MKKLFVICFILLISVNIFSQENSKEMERVKVAVVPSEDGDKFTSLVENALGSDNRFDFIDRDKIPAILEEWERRQAGITEDDDTESLALKNISYLVELGRVTITPIKKYREMPEKENKTVVDVIVENAEKEKYAYWEVTVRVILKVTNINEGGSTKTFPFARTAEAKTEQEAREMAINGLGSSIRIAVKKIFPIQAFIADVSYGNLKILRGSESGVREGQRYVIKTKKEITVRGKSYTSYQDVGFVQVYEVGEQFSEAFIIMADSISMDSSKAVEKYYSGGTFEINAGLIRPDTDDNISHNLGKNDFFGGFDLLFGNNFQVGFGWQFAYNDGFFRMSVPDFQLRYNIHLSRRLFLNFGAIGNVELAFKETELIMKDESDNEVLIEDKHVRPTGIAYSGNLFAGFKFHLSYSSYFFTQAGYTFANHYKWKFNTDQETDEQKKESIKDYTDYIDKYSPRGFTTRCGFGFNF